ncbi:GMP synthase [Shewanella sp. D64]|uniref:glutamine amidotransferase-related protein n=1 Tax=unclassified Shewanella TaxID=196818 RepID=UPI0022BA56E5|nr:MULTISPECIES: GMP synthase [unclassified Shewanella]MEC4724357.1 GMP synthase [Shewanella sp. D64]MEC4738869.1 GMP synthase [Shewanella sp. E94]WBJ97694.1 GMP synthase [Shewanella sp. MTB7]
MRIGILQCDDVTAALQAKHGNYPEMFTRLFEDLDRELVFVVYRVIDGDYPNSVDDCEAYITTGSRYGVNDDEPWVLQFKQYIATLYAYKKKLIGICFGHQMMVKALGGEVVKSPKGWGVGVATSAITLHKPWMDCNIEKLSLVVSHQDQVTVLPEDTEIIASSDFCPFYMIQINDHFLGIQGHPEFSKIYSQDLMNARRDRIPAQRIEKGIESLSHVIDEKRFTQWMMNFLRYNDMSKQY